MDIKIRKAESNDLVRMVEFRIKLQDHMEKVNKWILRFKEGWKDGLSDSYKKKIKDQNSLVLIAEMKPNDPVGMAIATIQEHPNFTIENSVKIDDVWVEEEFRRNNICKKLLTKIIEYYQAKGIKLFSLNYVENNIEAEKVWKRLGFNPAINYCMHYLDT